MNGELSPSGKAKRDFIAGLGLDSNPYPKGSKEREQYMLTMGKLQYDEFVGEQNELRAGV
jgi:hypothetical protein